MFKKTLKTCSPFSLHVSVSKIIAIVYLIRNLVIIFIQPELFLNLQSRLWSHVFPTVPQCGLHCHPNMIFFPLITFSSRESKQLDKCPAPMSPRLSCLLSLTLFNPGKINGSVHIVLDSYVCLLLWKNVIWLCYLITTFICLSCQHDCEHLEIRSGVKPELI